MRTPALLAKWSRRSEGSDHGRSLGTPSPDMAPRRRFTIGDAMVVVVMAACLASWHAKSVVLPRMIAYLRHAPEAASFIYRDGPRPAFAPNNSMAQIKAYLWKTPVTIAGEILLPLVIVATPAALLFRLRRPRPPWRMLLLQPGASACLTIVVVVLVEVDLLWMDVPLQCSPLIPIGASVALAWMLLKLTGRWSAESSWVDRLGRSVGISWVMAAMYEFVMDRWIG